MSVWKKLNKQDSFVTTYVAKKNWSLSGSDLETAGVKLLPAYSDSPIQSVALRSAGVLCGIELQAEFVGPTCVLIPIGSVIGTCGTELEAVAIA